MSQVYSAEALLKGLRTEFLKAYKPETTLIDKIAWSVTSEHDLEKYEWLGQAPQMQELTSEVVSTPMSATSYSITNGTYTAAITVKRSDLEDNKTQSLSMRIKQMAQTAAVHPNKLLINALVNGTSSTLGLGYDGVSFFNDSHTARGSEGGTQDNLLAGTGTTTSAFATDFATAKAQLLAFKDEAGEPFHGDGSDLKLVCVVPPALERSAREALNATIISNTSNVLVGQAEVIASPRLTSDANDWFLLATNPAKMPLIFQTRVPVGFEALEDGSTQSFFREQWHYKVRARWAAGYGFWQCAVKTVNT